MALGGLQVVFLCNDCVGCATWDGEIGEMMRKKYEKKISREKIKFDLKNFSSFPLRYACLLKIPLCKAIRSRWWSYFKCAMHKWKRSMSWHGMERWKLKSALKQFTMNSEVTKEQQMLRVHLGHVAHRKSGLVTLVFAFSLLSSDASLLLCIYFA